MKIINRDNFDRDSVPDKLVCENVSEHYGKQIVKHLNETWSGDHSPDWYVLVEDDHKLREVDY